MMKNLFFAICIVLIVFGMSPIAAQNFKFQNSSGTNLTVIHGDTGNITVYGSADIGGNVTASWFSGIFDWIIGSTSTNYLTFNGTQLDFNETYLNETVSSIGNGSYILRTGDTVTSGNYVFPANFTIDTSTFHVDSNNNRVGIGTISPSYALDVLGTIQASDMLRIDDGTRGAAINSDGSGENGNRSFLLLDQDSSDGIGVGSDYLSIARDGIDAVINNLGTGDIEIRSNSAAAIFIEGTNRNVGIGTTSPQSELHINSSGGSTQIIIDSDVGQASSLLFNDGGSPLWEVKTEASSDDFYIRESGVADRFIIQQGGNVGIGTITPSQKLEVNGSATDGGILVSGYNRPAFELQKGNTGQNWSIVSGVNDYLYIKPSLGATDSSDSDAAVTISNSGNVGIGTILPQYSLDVRGAISQSAANPTIILNETDTADQNYDIQVNGGSFRIYEVNAARDTFSERFTIDTQGNIGINTSTPQNTLNVAGDGNFTGTLTAETLDTGQGANELYAMDQDVLTTSDVQFNTLDVDNINGGIILTNSLNTSRQIRIGQHGASDSTLRFVPYVNSTFDFDKDFTYNFATEQWEFDGELLLGEDPTSSLGAATKQYVDTQSSSASSAGGWNDTGTIVELITPTDDVNATTLYVNNTSGRVGIGTSPDEVLTILTDDTEALHLIGSSSNNVHLSLDSISSGGDEWYVSSTADANSLGAGKFVITNIDESINPLVIDSTGNVGIGTTSPSRLLHVGGSTTDVVSAFESTDPGTQIVLTDSSGSLRLGTLNSGAFALSVGGAASSPTGANVTEALRVNSVGNVGIGTTSPQNALTIQELDSGANSVVDLYSQDGDGTDTVGYWLYAEGTPGDITNRSRLLLQYDTSEYELRTEISGTGSDYPINIYTETAGANQLFLNTDGNVGIGTSSPGSVSGAKLHVYESSGNVWSQLESGSNSNVGNIYTNNVTSWTVGVRGDDSDKFYIGNQVGLSAGEFVIDTSGQVGIGTTSPGRALDVQGVLGVQYNDTHELFGINPTSTGADFAIRDSGLNMDFRVDTRSGQEVAWYDGGNFGIGTSTPQNTLNVDGDANVTGTFYGTNADFNGGWSNGGVSIIDGEIYAQTGYFYNISSLSVTNLEVNGSVVPDMDNSFDLGNSTQRWRNLYLSGNADIDGTLTAGAIQSNDWTNVTINGSQVSDDGTYLLATGDTATGNYTFDSGTLFIDSTNNRIGVGTVSPLRELDVNGSIELSGSIYGTATDHTYYTIASGNYNHEFYTRTNTGASSERFRIEGGAAIDDVLVLNSNFNVNSGQLYVEQSTGEVGIRTTDPSEALQIGGGSSNADGQLSLMSATNNKGFLGGFEDAVALSINRRISDGTFTNSSLGHAEVVVRSSVSGGNIGFVTSNTNGTFGTERVRIDESGNVGIGTTSPSEVLDVNGSLRLEGAGTGSTVSDIYTSNSFLRLSAGGSGSDKTRIEFNGNDIDLMANNGGSIDLGEDTGTYQPYLTIESGGDVGIGTTTPNSTLDVDGIITGRASSQFYSTESGAEDVRLTFNVIDADLTKIYNYNESGNSFNSVQFGGTSAAETGLVVTGSGDVGIGTTSPDSLLHIAETGIDTNFLTLAGDRNNADSEVGILFRDRNAVNSGGDQVGRIYAERQSTSVDFDLVLESGSNNSLVEGLRIDHEGNVGIGTTSPSTASDLSFGATNSYISTDSSDGSDNKRLVFSGGGAADSSRGASIYLQGNEYGASNAGDVEIVAGAGAGEIRFYPNGSQQAVIDSSGNLGIGTTTPGEKLHVSGGDIRAENAQIGSSPLSSSAYFAQSSFMSGNDFAIRQSNTGATYVNAPSGQSVNLGINNNVDLRIDENGQVGINTTTPQNLLNVLGDANITGTLYTGALSASEFTTSLTEGSVVFIDSDGNLSQDNSNFYWNDISDRLGIGTNSPSSLLHLEKPSQDNTLSIIGQSGYNSNIFLSAAGSGRDAYITIGNDRNLFIESSSSTDPVVGGTNLLTIEPGGEVGIGTTTPAAKLEVNGSIRIKAADNTNTGLLVLENSNSTNFWDFAFDGSENLWLQRNGESIPVMFWNTNGRVGIGTSSPGSLLEINGTGTGEFLTLSRSDAGDEYSLRILDGGLTVYNNNDARKELTFDGTGDIGIGTATPGAPLEINSTVSEQLIINNPTASTGWAGISLIRDNGSQQWQVVSGLNSDTDNFGIEDVTAGGTALNSPFIIEGGSSSNALWLDNTGSVGIGTATPTGSLDINHTGNALRIQRTGYNTYQFYQSPGTGFGLQDVTNGNEIWYTTGTSGNLGINTTTPEELLHVRGSSGGGELVRIDTLDSWDSNHSENLLELYGGSAAASNEGGYFGIKLRDTADADKAVGLYAVSENTFSNRVGFAIYTNSDANTYTEKVRVTGTGNLGIGTTSPAYPLDIAATSSNQDLLRLSHPSSPTEAGFMIGFNTDGTTDNNVVTLGVEYSSTDYDVINIKRETRGVGIGTINPQSDLNVVGTFNATSGGGSLNVESDGDVKIGI